MESAATRVLVTTASGLLGLAVGSFLNVVIYRLPRCESVVHPPSHCPTCNTVLGPLENIPVVSWLALRGRCRHCAAPISLRYPIVELGTALLFVSMALATSMPEPLAPFDAVLAASIVIGATELDRAPLRGLLGWIVLASASTLVIVSLADHRLVWVLGAAMGAAAATGAWCLLRLGERHDPEGGEHVTKSLGGLALMIGWGWAAGWTGAVGVLIFGVTTLAAAIVYIATSRPRFVMALNAAAAIVAIVIGSFVGR